MRFGAAPTLRAPAAILRGGPREARAADTVYMGILARGLDCVRGGRCGRTREGRLCEIALGFRSGAFAGAVNFDRAFEVGSVFDHDAGGR